MIRIDIADEQDAVCIDCDAVRALAERVLHDRSIRSGQVSVAIVDDAQIGRLHKQFLNVEGPTDVISFPLESGDGHLEGEVVASAETAARTAPQYDWPAAHELLLYVLHGLLHLAGYDDIDEQDRRIMRQQERHYLGTLGLSVPQSRPAEATESESDGRRSDRGGATAR